MTSQRRQATFIDTYSDLPAWVRFGARVLEFDNNAFDSKHEPRTVVRITKTLVICVEGHDPDRSDAAEVKYRRANLGRIAPGTMDDGNRLVDPNAQGVRDALARRSLDQVYLDVARLHREQITHASREQRPNTVSAALARLDQLTVLIEEARQGIFDREAHATAARVESHILTSESEATA